MEQETLIYIEETDRKEAAKLSQGFTMEDTMARVYINTLGVELALKYLAQEGINVSNIYNLHSIHKIREEFDIADIMLPNIHIDVRVVYEEDLIFVPKSHFTYGLTPDIYLVLHMPEDSNTVKFLGFFEPKLINKNNQNENYYFIEKEKLSHPSDLKNYIEHFIGNTTEVLSDEEVENSQRLALSLIDHDINEEDKKNLINMLVKSSSLREDLIEFDNFELVSYHVATTEDFTDISVPVEAAEEVLPVEDEFDAFDDNDEFSNFSDTGDIFEETDEEISSEKEIESEEKYDFDTLTEDFDIYEEPVEEEHIIEEQKDVVEEIENTKADGSIISPEIHNELDNLLGDFNFDDETLEESDSTLEDIDEDLNVGEEIPEQGEVSDNQIHLDEFDELPFDTEENSEEVLSQEDDNINLEEPVEEVLTESFDNLETIEDISSTEEELPFEDTEISSIEDIEPAAAEETVEETETEIETAPLDALELNEETTVEEIPEVETVSFDDFATIEAANDENSQDVPLENTVSLDQLYEDINGNNEETEQEDFLEALAEEGPQQPVSYENSTIINNTEENFTPGEIAIDINQINSKNENDEDIEKLGVLYNDDSEFLDNTDNNLKIKTSMPEKGKKAIVLASAIIVALASLLIYAAMNKSNNKIEEQNNTSVLEKNLPKLEEQPLPEEAVVMPQKQTFSKPEEAAKEAVQNANTPKAPLIESPYIDVKKLSWAVPDYASYNDSFKKYLQTAGKSLKLSLSSDLLLATEYAYSNQVQVDVILSKEGSIQDAKILQSSGSTQIDDIVLRTVKDTLKVVKAPAGVIVGDNIHLTLKIYL